MTYDIPYVVRENEPPERKYKCPTCKDQGWIVEPDGGAGGAARCNCLNPRHNPVLLLSRLRATGMEQDELDSAYKPWDESAQPKPEWARHWLTWALTGGKGEWPSILTEKLGPRPKSPWVLTLLGKPGRGKTKTAAVLMRIYIKQGGTGGLWVLPTEGYDRVQGERKRDGESEYEQRISTAQFLVLDEFGRTHRKDHESIMTTVNEWLYRRGRRWLPTVIATNADKLEDLGDPRITSRLSAGASAKMGGPNYRDKEKT